MIKCAAPQFRSLCHTKAVLLVDDGKAQALEHHGGFQYGMGADQNLDIAGGEVGKNLFSICPRSIISFRVSRSGRTQN